MKYSQEIQNQIDLFLRVSVKEDMRIIAGNFLNDLAKAAFIEGEAAQIRKHRDAYDQEIASVIPQ